MSWCLAPELLTSISIERSSTGNYKITNLISEIIRAANPEEIIRQLAVVRLVKHYHVNPSDIVIEFAIQMGSTKKRADVVVIDSERNPILIIEVKAKDANLSEQQLFSYLHASTARFGMLVDSSETAYYAKTEAGHIQRVSDIPIAYNQISGDATELKPQTNTYGISRLVKEICEDSTEIWFVEAGTSRFQISIKELQAYQKLQTKAIENGQSLLNHNPSPSEWRTALHLLIKSVDVRNNRIEITQTDGYQFLLHIADMAASGLLDIDEYLSIRRDGNVNLAFNKVYPFYSEHCARLGLPAISKKVLVRALLQTKITIELTTGMVSQRTARSHILDSRLVPKPLGRLIGLQNS